MPTQALKTHQNEEGNSLSLSVDVPPRLDMQRIDLGEYESAKLVPRLIIECKPEEPGSVVWLESRPVMEDGAVRLFLLVQNFGMRTETMHIREADA
ncbi:hypothetical protein ACFT9I_27130 [Streptomyces sp. NPDC057137]|uniref:hypothetical protein n=1 Tax=Streptomyces sp. NPDC057137 TaxID=3346030 RepID=UPI00362F6875